MNHLPQRVVNLVQVDLLDFQSGEVLNQKQHETVIIRVMDELDEDALIVVFVIFFRICLAFSLSIFIGPRI